MFAVLADFETMPKVYIFPAEMFTTHLEQTSSVNIVSAINLIQSLQCPCKKDCR
jgi:hypothetical protein